MPIASAAVNVSPSSRNFSGAAPSHQCWEQGSFDHGWNAELYFGHSENRGIGGYTDIARRGNFQAAPERVALDSGDYRNRQRAQGFATQMQPGDEAFRRLGDKLRHFMDIRATDEGLAPCARQHYPREAFRPLQVRRQRR